VAVRRLPRDRTAEGRSGDRRPGLRSPGFRSQARAKGRAGMEGGIGLAARGPRPLEGGSRTLYLVTPVTYDAERADEQAVAQAFDSVVKDAAAAGALKDAGVESVGFSVIQPTGDWDEVPLGIEAVPDDAKT
jgi:hypothetical protein